MFIFKDRGLQENSTLLLAARLSLKPLTVFKSVFDEYMEPLHRPKAESTRAAIKSLHVCSHLTNALFFLQVATFWLCCSYLSLMLNITQHAVSFPVCTHSFTVGAFVYSNLEVAPCWCTDGSCCFLACVCTTVYFSQFNQLKPLKLFAWIRSLGCEKSVLLGQQLHLNGLFLSKKK